MNPLLAQTWLILRVDLRLMWRDLAQHPLREYVTFALVVVLFVIANVISIAVFFVFRKQPPLGGEMIMWLFFGLMMLGAAMNRAIVVLFERADFDLLLSSPVSPRAILLARLCTMFVGAALSAAFFLLPLIHGAMLALSWRYVAAYPVWLLLAAASASAGVWMTLLLVHLIGPRRARTWSQVVAAVVGGSVYLSFQLPGILASHVDGSTVDRVIRVLGDPQVAFIARAARGEPGPLAGLAAVTLGLLAATTWVLARVFISGIQAAGGIAPRRRRTGRQYVFVHGVARATFHKDLRLIWRDPLLLAQVLPQALYLVPMMLVFSRFGTFAILAPIALFLATQFSMVFTAVCASGEECWDLIRMSPTAELRLRVAKLVAGMALPIGFAAVISATIAVMGRPGLAVLTLACSVACAAGCSWLQVTRITPTPRRDILHPRRRSADQPSGMNFGRGLVGGFIMFIGAAGLGFGAAGKWTIASVLLGIMALALIGCFTLVHMEGIPARHFSSAVRVSDES